METANGINAGFGIPDSIEAALRARAEGIVAANIDEDALLARYVVEAQTRKETALRERAAATAGDGQKDLDAHGFPKKYMEINIFKGKGKELSYVPVGVNGFVWKIARGQNVIVHSVVVDALNEAITEEVVQAEGGLITQPVHRFPFQILRASVSEAEHLAFREKMKAAGKAATLATA